MLLRILFITCCCLISVLSSFNFAFADAGDFWGWMPTFYNSSMQEGRNICIGVILADKSKPGLDSSFGVSGFIFDTDTKWIVIDEEYFEKESADAWIRSEFTNDDGENYNLYLFIIPDACVLNKKNSYSYMLHEVGVPIGFPDSGGSLSYMLVEYVKIDEDCEDITEDTCSSMDLTEFYSWEADDDDDTVDDDDDTLDDDNNSDDDDDDQCGCGCNVSGNGTAFTLTLVMFAIGAIALMIARKRASTHDTQR